MINTTGLSTREYHEISRSGYSRFGRFPLLTFTGSESLQSFQTQRAADRMSVVFRFAMDGESKNPDSNAASGLTRRGKVLSFAYFSLHEQRKVGRASALNVYFLLSEENSATTPELAPSPILHRSIK
jgi:hypothetical protein